MLGLPGIHFSEWEILVVGELDTHAIWFPGSVCRSYVSQKLTHKWNRVTHFCRWSSGTVSKFGRFVNSISNFFFTSNQSWQTQAHSCQRHGLRRNEPILLVWAANAEGCVVRQAFGRGSGLWVGWKEGIKYCGERKRGASVWALAWRGRGILNEWRRMGRAARRAAVQRLPRLTAGCELRSAATVYYLLPLSTWMQPTDSQLNPLRVFQDFTCHCKREKNRIKAPDVVSRTHWSIYPCSLVST